MRAKTRAKFRFRRSLFWDVTSGAIDPCRHARHIIERILGFGDMDEVKWLAHTCSRRLIKDVIARSRVLHEKPRSLWRLVFD